MTLRPRTWRLAIPKDIDVLADVAGNYVVEGSGPAPVAVLLAPPPSPPGGPPLDDAALQPQPGEDQRPHEFPEGGPTGGYQDGDRSYPLALDYPGADYHVNEASAGNPVGTSHRWAGRVLAGHASGHNVAGMNLWARVVPGEGLHGERLPAAPGYLIRRALDHGTLLPGGR
jgi:hypothetical protein